MKKKLPGSLKAIPFLLPFFVVYVVFTIFPIFKGLEMSLYNWSLFGKEDFKGFQNYVTMLNDPAFWESLWNTTFFVFLMTPTMMVLALVLALIANRNSRLRTFYRMSFFMPFVLSVSVISYIAIFMLQPYDGFINSFLQMLGFEQKLFWLKDPVLAWISIVVVSLWWTVGFNMILFLAGLQEIPGNLYEAARIDGATPWKMFFHVTLPLLIPISRVILLLQILGSFKVFAQILLITGGGPGTETRPTPHIESLADSGVLFEKAFCNYPACTPSRASMMTGRYTSTIQTHANHMLINPKETTLPLVLREHGYQTAIIGKNHAFMDGRQKNDYPASNIEEKPDELRRVFNYRCLAEHGHLVDGYREDKEVQEAHQWAKEHCWASPLGYGTNPVSYTKCGT
ncbi:sulfatase-like hydrolase/transferase [Salibacterium aidingense]|uniref:sulfatase-like hydrolase/transferase n=1 Tax=Salibacterium aidingense TaxID=384933 RepID=UPI003BC01F5F